MLTTTLRGAISMCAALVVGLSAAAIEHQDAVRVTAGSQVGGGFSIANEGACLIVTAKHVVADEIGEPHTTVSVSDHNGTARSAFPVYSAPTADLALYRISDPSGFHCGRAWENGSNAFNAAQASDRLILLKRGERGDETRIFLDFVGTAGDTHFRTYPRFAQDPSMWPRQGDSGSPIFSPEGVLIGIAQDVNAATGETRILSQRTIESELGSRVQRATRPRILVSQVTQNGNAELRQATLSLLDNLGRRQSVTIVERDRFYLGSRSWAGNIEPRWASQTNAPRIAQTDYYIEADVVSVTSGWRSVPKYETQASEEVSHLVTGAIFKGLFGSSGEQAANQARQERERMAQERKNVLDVSVDLEMRFYDTATGSGARHREQFTTTVDTQDHQVGVNRAVELAIANATDALLQGYGL